jgi:antitoxin ParD1/3/4
MPAAPRTISFTDRHLSLLDRLISDGRHSSSSEVIREALRRYEADLDREEAHLDYLRRLGDEGEADIAAGRFTDVRHDQLHEFFESLDREALGK